MPWVFGELKSDIRICKECGDISLEDEAHWHPELVHEEVPETQPSEGKSTE